MNYAKRALTLLTLSHFMYGHDKFEHIEELYDWYYACRAKRDNPFSVKFKNYCLPSHQ